MLTWTLQLAAAASLGQTLCFKSSGAAETRWIFAALGAEPRGRWAAGLAAAVLLARSRTAALGALFGAGVMQGAIGSHLMVLCIEVQGDGGLLFTLAVVTLAACAGVAWLRRGALHWPGRAIEEWARQT